MDNDGKQRKAPEPLKAFKNPGFLQSKDARLIRMLSEYLEPASRLKWQRVRDTIVFFGSARALPLEESQTKLNSLRESSTAGIGTEADSEAIAHMVQEVRLSRYYEDACTLAELIVHGHYRTLDLAPLGYARIAAGRPFFEEAVI